MPAKIDLPPEILERLGKVPDCELAREAGVSHITIRRARLKAGIPPQAGPGHPLADPEAGPREATVVARVLPVTRAKLEALAEACEENGLGRVLDRLVGSSAAAASLGRVQRERYKALLRERGIE